MNLPRTLLLVLLLQAPALSSLAQPAALLTPTNSIWRYLTNGTYPGIEWTLPDFDDSAWPSGVGLFGNDGGIYSPLGFNTPVAGPFAGSGITTYFRTRFNWNGPPWGITLTGTNYVDDGCVVYLNGVEITRFNMPSGPPASDTLAIASNPGGFPNMNGGEPVLVRMEIQLGSLTNGNANPLVNGVNVLAVEVHQSSAASSDVVFGMSLFAGECAVPCLDGVQPTNRVVLQSRSTTFVVSGPPDCGIPTPTYQWFRDVGAGEELIPGATASSYTLTNAQDFVDDGSYYCRLTTFCGSVDTRRAVLDVQHTDDPPVFLSASIVGPAQNKFRLVTEAPLCGDMAACGSDYANPFQWQILQADGSARELIVTEVVQINPTTYEFTTIETRDPERRYRIAVHPAGGQVSGLTGLFVPPGTFADTPFTLSFQQGDYNGYTGTQDAEIHSNATADTLMGTITQMSVDLDDSGVAQSLLRFDNLFGAGRNRIPFGSRIISATLTLNQIDPGDAVNLHRIIFDWNQSTVTWTKLGDGVSADDIEARFVHDATKPAGTTNSLVVLDVTTSVQAWLDGQPNYGWALLSTGSDGWTISTSEIGGFIAPMLTVAYENHMDVCEPAILVQPPASITPAEAQTVVIAVTVTNTFMPVFQWTKNGEDIPGANQPIFSIPSVSPLHAGTYRLRMSCGLDPSRAVTSNPCVLILGDNFPPYLTAVAAELDGITISLRFSEPMDHASAENIANYVLNPPLPVLAAAYSNSSVTLVTAPREVGSNYTLRVANVADASINPALLSPNPTVIALTTARVIVAWDADGWHYNTNNLDAVPDWKNPTFTPGSDWGFGPGLFGTETSVAVLASAPAPFATPLAPNSIVPGDQLTTTYFRRIIDLPALRASSRYVLCHYTDDGFIAYLDGAEIHRFAMPAGPITFTNRSTAIPTGDATYRSFTFEASPGLHTLAVELHQASVTSSDVIFGMEVRVVDGTPPALTITRHGGRNLSLNWKADNNWRLRRAATLNGPYLDVATPPAGRWGFLNLFSSAITTQQTFFRLEYTGNP